MTWQRDLFAAPALQVVLDCVTDRREIDNPLVESLGRVLPHQVLEFVRKIRHVPLGILESWRVAGTNEEHNCRESSGVAFTLPAAKPDLVAAAVEMQSKNDKLHRSDNLGLGVVDSVIAKNNSRTGHESSLTGHGADPVSAPKATAEAPTSVVGDIVRDAPDTSSGSYPCPGEESGATGAAASEGSQSRPHHNPSTQSGSDQR